LILTWLAPTNDGGSPLTGYRIFKSWSDIDNWTIIVPATTTNYMDHETTIGSRYTYRVAAINLNGESDPSDEVTYSCGDDDDGPIVPIIAGALLIVVLSIVAVMFTLRRSITKIP